MKTPLKSPLMFRGKVTADSIAPRVRFDLALAKVKPHCESAMRVVENLPTDDDKFMVLYRKGAEVSKECENITYFHSDPQLLGISRLNLKLALQQLAALGLAWLATQAQDQDEVFEAVWIERERQMALRRANPQKYRFAMEHPTPDVRRKFRVQAEEIGEVADAIDALECAPVKCQRRARFHRDDEIIHATAVAVAWLESFEVTS